MSAISGQIQGRELVVVAMRVEDRWLRFIPFPRNRIAALANWTSLVVGSDVGAAQSQTNASFRFAKPPRLEDLVSAARLTVFDEECVDDPESYRDVVQDILALSGGVLQADYIDCDEDDEERRHLQITAGGEVFQADLEGGTDWGIFLPFSPV